MLNRLDQVRYKLLRILRRWEVSQLWHGLVFCTGDLICGLLRHLWRVRPVVLTGKHKYRTCVRVDAGDAGSAVPATEVEV